MENEQQNVNRENPLFGRKVFFVNPPLAVENNIVSELRDEEYEAYIIRDYRYVKPVLCDNKDALVFIYIDDQLSYDQWFNYIKSFETDEKLNSIFIGVISAKANYEDQQRYIMDLKLPGGFIMLNERIESITKKIKAILDLNGAKGRRQYIRLDCRNLDSVKGHFTSNNRLFMFSIDNISSVGFACVYSPEITNLLQKNTLQPSVTVTLGRKAIDAPSVVFDTRIVNEKGFSVLLFTNNVPRETKNSIKSFIFDILDSKLKEVIANSIQDLTDYSEKIKTENDSSVPEYADIQDAFINILDEGFPEIPDL